MFILKIFFFSGDNVEGDVAVIMETEGWACVHNTIKLCTKPSVL